MKRLSLIVAFLLILTGCTAYYRVTDLSSGTEYYTTRIKRMESGAINFEDSRTGSEITLPSSKISKVNKQEFKYGGESE